MENSKKRLIKFHLIPSLVLGIIAYILNDNYLENKYLHFIGYESLEPRHVLVLHNIDTLLYALAVLVFISYFILPFLVKVFLRFYAHITNMNKKKFLIKVLVIAFILRISVIFIFPTLELGTADSYRYHETAKYMKNGEGFIWQGKPTAFTPVGYTAFLAVLYSIFGEHYILGKFANLLFSLGIIILVFLICCIIWNEKAARFSALVYAFMPTDIFYSAWPMSEPGFLFFVLLSVYLLLAKDTWKHFVMAGISIACAIYFRPVALPILIAFPMYILVFNRKTFSIRKYSIWILTTILLIIPWTIRNYVVLGGFVPVSSNGGYNLFIGNNPIANGEWNLPEGYDADIKHLSEVEQSNALSKKAVDYIKNNPLRFVDLCFKTFIKITLRDTTSVSRIYYSTWVYNSPAVTFVLYTITQIYYMLIFAGFLIYLIFIIVRKRYNNLWTLPLFMFLYFTGIYLPFFGLPRFHYPILPFYIMSCSVMITTLQSKLTQSESLSKTQ